MDTPLTAAQKRRLRRKKSKKRTTGDDEGPDAAVNGPTVADGETAAEPASKRQKTKGAGKDPASTKKPRTKKSKKATRVAAESDELNPPQSAGDDAGSDGGIGTSAAATVAAAAAAASPGGTTSAAAASPSLGSGDLSEAEVKPEKKKKKKKKKNKEKEKAKKKGKKGTKRPAPQSSDGEGSGDHESGSGGADPSASRRPAAKVRKERASTTPSRGGPNKVIPLFSARRLRPGSLILGVVARVRARHVEVSLPNGAFGRIPMTEISTTLNEMIRSATSNKGKKKRKPAAGSASSGSASDGEGGESSSDGDGEGPPIDVTDLPKPADLIKPGQYVRCAVLDAQKRTLMLSVLPSKVNAAFSRPAVWRGLTLVASVASVEDHGYILDLGIEGMSGFLKKKTRTKNRLRVGASLLVVVETLSKDRSLATVELAGKTDPVLADKANMISALPGTRVSMKATTVVPSGVIWDITKLLSATSDRSHSGVSYLDDIADLIEVGDTREGRIICLDAEGKSIFVSLAPHVVALAPAVFPDGLPVGELVEDATVVRVFYTAGAVVDLGGGTAAFVSKKRLNDDPEVPDNVNDIVNVNDVVSARVTGHQLFDGSLTATLRPSDLEARYLRTADVSVGDVVKVSITKVTNKYLLVSLGHGITGVVPAVHMADTMVTDPLQRFNEGKKLRCRVLKVDKARGRCTLTAKKTLVTSPLPPITKFYSVSEGDVAHGVVTKVLVQGLKIGFFGNVQAYAPRNYLSKDFIDVPGDAFHVGQVVKARILSVDKTSRKLRASLVVDPDWRPPTAPTGHFDVEADADAGNESNVEAFKSSSLGRVMSVRVLRTAGTGLHCTTADDVVGFLPKQHLSDHPSLVDAVLATYAAGDIVDQAVVIGRNFRNKRATFSAKPSMVNAALKRTLTSRPDALQAGQEYVATVASTAAFGVFISFPGGAEALVGMKDLANRFIKDTAKEFVVGQTVFATVSAIDPPAEYGQRPRVSAVLNVPLTGDVATQRTRFFLESYFADQARIDAFAARGRAKAEAAAGDDDSVSDDGVEDDPLPSVGDVVEGVVESVLGYGVILDLVDSDAKAFATEKQVKGANPTVGGRLSARVLSVDVAKRILDVSLRPEFVMHGADAASTSTPAASLVVGTRVPAIVELAKDDFVVVSLPDHGARLAFGANASFNDRHQRFKVEQTGYKVGATVVGIADDGAVLVELDSRLKLDAGLDTSILSVEQLRPGQKLRVKVKGLAGIQANVRISHNVQARIHVSEVLDNPPAPGVDAFANIAAGDILDAKVLAIHERKSKKVLDISHPNPAPRKAVELTVRPGEMALPDGELTGPRITINELSVGDILDAYVHQITRDCLWVAVTPLLRGRVFMLDASNDVAVLRKPNDHFATRQHVRAAVTSVDKERNRLDLSLIKVAASGETIQEYAVGDVVAGRVVRVTPGVVVSVMISSNTYGRVFVTDVADDWLEHPMESVVEGQLVSAVVIGINPKGKIDLSLAASDIAAAEDAAALVDFDNEADNGKGKAKGKKKKKKQKQKGKDGHAAIAAAVQAARNLPVTVEDVAEGDVVHGYVRRTTKRGVFVDLSRSVSARVHLHDAVDRFTPKEDLIAQFTRGTLVVGRILKVDPDENAPGNGRIEMSLKPSVVTGVAAAKGSSSKRKKKAAERPTSLADLSVGQVVNARISNVVEYGVFLRVDGQRHLAGLCHRANLDTLVKNLSAVFAVGDRVQALITNINHEEKKISFSLKRTEVAAAQAEAAGSGGDGNDNNDDNDEAPGPDDVVLEPMSDGHESSDDDIASLIAAAGAGDASDDSESAVPSELESSSGDGEVEEEAGQAGEVPQSNSDGRPLRAKAALKVGFDWGVDDLLGLTGAAAASTTKRGKKGKKGKKGKGRAHGSGSGSSSSTSSASSSSSSSVSIIAEEDIVEGPGEVDVSKTKAKRLKKVAKRKAEDEVRRREEELADAERLPETAEDFERLVVGDPNASYAWIQYMAFKVSTGDVDAARALGERALKTISFREEKEKLNVWVALLNLENTHGTPTSLKTVFEAAAAHNDALTVYYEMANIYEASERWEPAVALYNRMVKKFRDDPKVWVAFGRYLLRQDDAEGAHDVMKRAIQSLPRVDHFGVVKAFAHSEYKIGDPERGRTMMEELLAQYPKRADLWNVYLDMELRRVPASVPRVRRLFDRVTSLSFSTKKMQYFLKRFMAFESKHGDAESEEHVRDVAREYLSRKVGGS